MVFILFFLFFPQFFEEIQVEYVLFNVKVFDKNKEPVLGLKKNDFELYVDLHNVKIEHFSLSTSDPNSIFIMLDSSGSMGLGDLWEKAYLILENIEALLKLGDEIALFIFQSDSFRLLKNFQDKERAVNFFKEITPWGKTALYDALSYSTLYFKNSKNKDRRIIIITDTHDNFSKQEPKKVIDALLSTSYPCHIFALRQTNLEPLEIDFFKYLSQYSNGSLHIIESKEEIQKEVDNLFNSFSKEYLIGFAPDPKSVVKYHTVLVSTKNKGYKVETRKGYYGKKPKV